MVKPYSELCCGKFLYWISKTLCLRCNADVRLYEKAKQRDAVRRWLMHARMQKRQSMEPVVRYDVLNMKHKGAARSSSPDVGPATPGSPGTPNGTRRASPSADDSVVMEAPSARVRRGTRVSLYGNPRAAAQLQRVASRPTTHRPFHHGPHLANRETLFDLETESKAAISEEDDDDDDEKLQLGSLVAGIPLGYGARGRATGIPESPVLLPPRAVRASSIASLASYDSMLDADEDLDPLAAPSMRDLLGAIDDGLNVFGDYDEDGDGSPSGNHKSAAVRQVPAVEYQYDNALNELELFAIFAAAVSILMVLAIVVDRREKRFEAYDFSIEAPATWVVYIVNTALFLFAISSFWHQFRGIVVGALSAGSSVLGVVGSKLEGPCSACGSVCASAAGACAYAFCCVCICVSMCSRRRAPNQTTAPTIHTAEIELSGMGTVGPMVANPNETIKKNPLASIRANDAAVTKRKTQDTAGPSLTGRLVASQRGGRGPDGPVVTSRIVTNQIGGGTGGPSMLLPQRGASGSRGPAVTAPLPPRKPPGVGSQGPTVTGRIKTA